MKERADRADKAVVSLRPLTAEEESLKEEILDVVREPAIKLIEKLVERKVRAVDLNEFTEDRKKTLVTMAARQVLASLTGLTAEAGRVPSNTTDEETNSDNDKDEQGSARYNF